MFLESSHDLQVVEVQGVLLGMLEQWDADDVLKRWQISTGVGCVVVTISSTDLAHAFVSEPLRPYRFQLIRWGDPDDAVAPLMVIGANRIPYAHAIAYLPAGMCPVPGVMGRATDVIDVIETEPLRQFVHAVLEDRFVNNHFWTMPASMRHHHACPGGLAQHSVEVAEDMAAQGQLTPTERDLGVAGGLLHDIGKVWSYTRDMFLNVEGLAMGHELTGRRPVGTSLAGTGAALEAWRLRHAGVAQRLCPDAFGWIDAVGSPGPNPCRRPAQLRAQFKLAPAGPGRSWMPEPYDTPF